MTTPAVREAAFVTQEAVYGTFNSGATSGQKSLLRLGKDNAVDAEHDPIFYTTREAGLYNTKGQTGSAQFMPKLKISTGLYMSQAKLLLGFLRPTGTPYDLKSFTLDRLMMEENSSGTLAYRRYTGCKIETASITATNQGEGVKFQLDMTGTFTGFATITATDFPMPAPTDYPSDQPLVFQMLGGGNLIFGSARSKFRGFKLDIKNILGPEYDENPFPDARWMGSDVSFETAFRWVSETDRAAYRAVTARAASAVLTDGTTTITFGMGGNNYLTKLDQKRPLGNRFYEDATADAYFDTAAVTDLSITVAP